MFDFAWSEMLLCAAVALIVIGPNELPQTMRTVGRWVGKARGVARHFRSGFDAMVREAELEEMDKRWRQENERIMREHPTPASEEAVSADVDASGDGKAVSPGAQPMLPLTNGSAPAADTPETRP